MAIKTVVINKGLRGNSVLNGTGVPSAVLGINGDFYIDTAALKIYGPKASGLWGSGTSLGGGGSGTLPNNTYFNARNAANDGNVGLYKLDASNVFTLGDGYADMRFISPTKFNNIGYYDASSDRTISMYAPPGAVTSNYSLILPAAQGTGSLSNDGAGNLSWSAGGGIDWSTPVDADIIPDVDLTRSIGSHAFNFANINTNNVNANNLLTINAQYGINVAPGNPTIALLTSGSGSPIRMLFNTTGDAFGVSIKAPSSLTQTTDYVWPLTDGTNGQVLSTDGAGQWSWIDAGGGGNETLVFAAANNQASPADVTGLILNPDVQNYYYINVTANFATSGPGAVDSNVAAVALAVYLPEEDTWTINIPGQPVAVAGPTDPGFALSVSPTGQVQYTTGDVTNGGTTGTAVDSYNLTFLITDPGGVSGGGGGSTSPGGPDRAIQFAAMGTFDGEANFLWTSNQLQITNEITSPASAASYAIGIKNNGDYALTLGGDNTATYIQAWNNKPLWINQFGNNVGIGTGLAAIDEMLVVGGNIKTGNSVFAGDFRAANEAYFLSRNAADNAYISLIKADSSNQVVIGDASQVIRNLTTRFDVISSSQVNFYAGNAQVNILSNGAGAPAVRWHDDDSSNFIGLKAPSVVPSNIIYTWPAVDAVGSLTSDGAGNLSWAAGGGATVALDNLASVAINTPLLPGTQDTVNFGSDIKSWFAVFGNQFQLFNGGDQKAYWIWDGGSDSVFMVTEKNQTIHSSKRLTLEAGSATDQGFLFGGNGQLYFGDGSNLVPLTNGAIDVGISGNQIGTVHTLAVASDSNLSISSSNTILTAGLLTLFNSPTDPAGGVAGSMYFNTGINKAKVHNGTSWEVITSS